MKRCTLLLSVVAVSFVLLFCSFAAAADPKEMVEEIFETKEVIERSVRSGDWAKADQGITTLENQMKELVAALQLSDGPKYNKQIELIAKGMHKAVAEKEDEGYEGPAHAMMDQTLKLMEKIDYSIPPVFVIIQRQVEESLELVDEGDFEALEEEMEEIVNLREEARSSAKEGSINPDKVNVLLDLAWDVSRDADGKNAVSAKKRLKRMQSILTTL